MNRTIVLPPENGFLEDGARVGGWWHETDDGRVVCDLCPRACNLKEGDRGFCFVRENRDGQVVLTTYGRSTGFCVDPIEKKPLNHFLPGTSVLSFGTAGCNLGCKFCQNWDISKSREVQRLSEQATPENIAAAARSLGCRSVAYTYNDPIIWAEYAIDCARACREVGVKSVAVTAGYVSPEARGPFFHEMDAANVDLKAFTEEFYYQLTYSHLQPVLDTLSWLKHESDVWIEITNLIIPRANDSSDELRQMCDWILEHVGPDVPVHFTAFHPDFRMKDRPATSPEALLEAYDIAQRQGIKFPYVGNVHDVKHQSTYCPSCKKLLIERDWHQLGQYRMRRNTCEFCGETIAGLFEEQPGDWGRRRLPVKINQYAPSSPPATGLPKKQEKKETMATASNSPSSQSLAAPPTLSDSQNAAVHHAACEFVASAIDGSAASIPDASLAGAADLTVMGAFVTAKRKGRLRGCCGWLGKPMKLIEALRNSAVRTAKDDQRMPPIALRELSCLDIDVTLLAGFQQVTASGRDRINAVEIGKHGLQIQRGDRSGLLLPSVATELKLSSEEFLRQVCRKAGLPSNAWEDDATRLLTFLGLSVSDPFDESVQQRHPVRPLAVGAGDMLALDAHVKNNVHSLFVGSTPSYYLPGVADTTVTGVVLTVTLRADGQRFEMAKISIRPGVPLQTTIFQLCDAAAKTLRKKGMTKLALADFRVGLTILGQPSMNGTVAQPDLQDLNPRHHVVTVTEAGRTAWSFDSNADAAELVRRAAAEARVSVPEHAPITGFTALSNENAFCFGNAPRALDVTSARPAAVAGKFYPASSQQLNSLVQGFLGKSQGVAQRWPAAMVPHAGLVYSGQIAANVFRRLELPETIIIIGPKHTRLGVQWAVSPNESWSLPGGAISSDRRLATDLAAAIDRLELDASAHQQEHAIEVELPFIASLSPKSKVVGIALGNTDYAGCREFAAGLAKVIKQQPKPPLLLISSDMNHFATDAENRRLDEMALKAMETLDPEQLFSTVRKHDISMCGVVPAVIVMETLRHLGALQKSERVGYATSADVSGDKSRVVGYAGMLLGPASIN